MKSDGVPSGFTGDKTRDKCIELVYDALASDSGARSSSFCSPRCILRPISAVDLILQKAKAIEAAVYSDIGGVTQPYPTKMRSLFVNLKDKNNPSLREAVGSGDIPVEKFVKMTSQVRPHSGSVVIFSFSLGNGL
jgi:transcription elongation factor S-II